MIFPMNTSHTLPRVIPAFSLGCMLLGVSLLGLSTQAMADNSKPLQPISASEWNADKARHLLERAGFGGTPQEVARLAVMTPEQVQSFQKAEIDKWAQVIKAANIKLE